MALPLKASPSPSREVILQEAVKGIRYGLFEDEDCLVPLVDENNQPIEVVSDEEGKLDINIETDTPFYLLQTGSTVGYHYDPVIYPTDQDRFILPVYPIEVGGIFHDICRCLGLSHLRRAPSLQFCSDSPSVGYGAVACAFHHCLHILRDDSDECGEMP